MESIELDGGAFLVRVSYEVNQDGLMNRSTVRLTRVELKATSNMSATRAFLIGNIYVNGALGVHMTFDSNRVCDATLSSQDFDGGGEVGPGRVWGAGFSSTDVSVDHQEDGTAEISIGVNLQVFINQSGLVRVEATGSTALPRIPRASALTAAGVALGQEMILGLTRLMEDCVDTVTWRCGSESGTLAEKTQATQLRWVVPLELAAQAPEDIQTEVILTVTSFLGEVRVGSLDTRVVCTVPEEVVPTMQVVVEDRLGCPARYGGYVQGQSQARVRTEPVGPFGASIRDIRVQCGKLSGTGADVCFALEESGSVPITVTVTDSRGRTGAETMTIDVLAYRKPQVTIREAGRCDEAGNDQPEGIFIKLVFDATVTALVGNTVQYRAVTTVHGGSEVRQVLLTDYTDQPSVTGGRAILTAGADTGYDCRISVQDDFSTAESVPVLVSVAFALLDLCRTTRAVGIGMRARNAGKLSVGMDTDMEEHRIGNLLPPEQDMDAATKGYVDERLRQLAQALGVTMEEDT